MLLYRCLFASVVPHRRVTLAAFCLLCYCALGVLMHTHVDCTQTHKMCARIKLHIYLLV